MRARMLTTVFALALVAAPAAAQSEWLAAEGTGVALEFRHPSFSAEEANDELGALDGAWFLSGRVGVPVFGAAAVVELPFANSSVGDGDFSLGNVYLGGEMPLMLGAMTLEAGVRLPTAGEPETIDELLGTVIAIAPSVADRYDAFVPEVLVPRVGLRAGLSATSLISVEANAAGAYMIHTGEGDTDNDFYIDYGARAFAGLAATRIGLGIEGAQNVTADEGVEASIHQLGVWVDHAFGMIRPGVSLFLPIGGDYADTIDYVLGVSLEIDLPM